MGIFWISVGRIVLWQQIFGERQTSEAAQNLYLTEKIEMLPESFEQVARFGEYDVALRFRAVYQVYSRAMYVDIYDRDFRIGFKSLQDKYKAVYNAVSPLDLSLFIGETAAEGNWQKIDVSHEYRVVLWEWKYKDNPVVNRDEISNNHILTANLNVRRGFDTIKKGDLVYLSGYLLDWEPLGEYSDMVMKTALTPGEIADFKLGGKTSNLCRYFYVERLETRGYVYQ